METIEVLAQDGRVLRSFCVCALCDRLAPLCEVDVFEGPGQAVAACVDCLREFEQYLSADPGEPLPHELSYEPIDDGWSSYDDAAQSDAGDFCDQRFAS